MCLCMPRIHWGHLCVGPLTNLCFAILKFYCGRWLYVGALAFIVSLSYLAALQKLPWAMKKHLCCQFCKDLPKWRNENIREVVSFWREPIRKCISRMLFLLVKNKKSHCSWYLWWNKRWRRRGLQTLVFVSMRGKEIQKHLEALCGWNEQGMKQLRCCSQGPRFICFGGNHLRTFHEVRLLLNCTAQNVCAHEYPRPSLCPIACLSLVSASREWKRVVVASLQKEGSQMWSGTLEILEEGEPVWAEGARK